MRRELARCERSILNVRSAISYSISDNPDGPDENRSAIISQRCDFSFRRTAGVLQPA
jgi:hypothetical protein